MKFNNFYATYFALFILFSNLTWAQVSEEHYNGATIQYNEQHQPVMIHARSGQEEQNHLSWLKNHLQLSNNESFKLIKRQEDNLGFTHYRYQLMYNAYPVENKTYIVHVKENTIKSANGDYVKLPDINVTIGINEADALKHALKQVNAEVYKWEVPAEEKRLKSEEENEEATFYPKGELVITSSAGKFILCYRFDIYALRPSGKYDVYINANNGLFVKKESDLHHIDSLGLADTKYYGMQHITTEHLGGVFRLREKGRGKGIETYTLNGKTDLNLALDISDSDNVWDSLPGNLVNGVQAHFGAEVSYDYFKETFGRNSIDGDGFKLISYVLYGDANDQTNAFWDGSRMIYTNPAGNAKAVTILDVVGHEITHGLSQFTANFARQGEAAALNESCSDIFGAMIERYKFPSISDSENFVTGEQIIEGGARSFINPKARNCPNTYKGEHWDSTGQQYHSNGVVQSYWFYLLCRGKSGTNDVGNVYSVDAIGIKKANDIIYRALTTYYTSDMNFMQARLYTMEAAKDLYGACSAELKSVANAWNAVGVGGAYTDSLVIDFSFKPVPCTSPTKVVFSNASTGTNDITWTFGDGGTSNQFNPLYTYSQSGIYTIKLQGNSCKNVGLVESKEKTITINNEVICDEVILKKSGKLESFACKGVLYDDGKDSIYSNNTSGYVVLAPSNASGIKLSFDLFDMGPFQDQLIIYAGSGTGGDILHTFSIFNQPSKELIIDTSVITIQQRTDDFTFQGMTNEGFKIFWDCIQTTGIDDKTNILKEVVVYPNPAKESIVLKVPQDILGTNVHITLYNHLGETLLVNKLEQPTTLIDTSKLKPGIYIYEIIGSNTVKSGKVVIY